MRGMNKLPFAKRAQILTLLCEGVSMRSISRIADVSINTVSKLLVDGAAPKPSKRGPYKARRPVENSS